MAHTAGSNFPMAPANPAGDGASKTMAVPIDTSMTELRNGDVMCTVQATGYPAANNTADGRSTDDVIMGIALLPGTGEVSVTATPDTDAQPGPNTAGTIDVVNIALALPGAFFLGNIVAGANDETGVAADNLRQTQEIFESDQGHACLDQTQTAGDLVAMVLEYTSPQYLVASTRWQYGRLAGVGIINPRARFCFLTEATIFGSSLPIA